MLERPFLNHVDQATREQEAVPQKIENINELVAMVRGYITDPKTGKRTIVTVEE